MQCDIQDHHNHIGLYRAIFLRLLLNFGSTTFMTDFIMFIIVVFQHTHFLPLNHSRGMRPCLHFANIENIIQPSSSSQHGWFFKSVNNVILLSGIIDFQCWQTPWGAESSLPAAHPGYRVLSDILFRLSLIANLSGRGSLKVQSYNTINIGITIVLLGHTHHYVTWENISRHMMGHLSLSGMYILNLLGLTAKISVRTWSSCILPCILQSRPIYRSVLWVVSEVKYMVLPSS